MRDPAVPARASFYDRQAHHRRAAWGWSVSCGALALALAAVASLVLTPAVLVAGAALARLVHEVHALPEPVWDAFRRPAAVLEGAREALADRRLSAAEVRALAPGLALMWVPAMGIVLVLWGRVRRALYRQGGMGVATAIGGRPPRAVDPEERQLVHVIEEMALAAGLAPPPLLLVDGEPANAAVIGASADTAVIVVTRPLLAALPRDETQAVVGHLLATVANGDPRLGTEVLAVAQTFGLLLTALEAPLNRTARRTLGRVIRSALRPGPASPADHQLIMSRTAGALDMDTLFETGGFIDAPDRPGVGALKGCLLNLRLVLLAPLFGVILVAKLMLLFGTLLLVGPALWSMMRNRRYLADATAVELTRNPEALGSALAILDREGGLAGSTRWAFPFFMGSGGASDAPLFLAGVHPPIEARRKRLVALGGRPGESPAVVAPDRPGAPPAVVVPDSTEPATVSAGRGRRAAAGVLVAAGAVLAAVLIGAPALGFIAYLLSVPLLFAVLVVTGAYAGALWVVAHLIP